MASTDDDASMAQQAEPHAEKNLASNDAPDGGYGWVVVACSFFINFHSWGINSTYSIFLAYYLRHDYFPGATYLQFAFVGGLSISMAMLVAPLATNCTRWFGTKATISIGVVLETLALITAGSASQIWQLFLSQGVCFGFGMGFLFVGSVGLSSQWFTKRRGLANGICASGSGIGALTYSLAGNAIIDRLGLPWAFRILGICCFITNTVATILIKDRHKAANSRIVGLDLTLFRRFEFTFLQAWGFLSMLGYVVLLFSLPDYAQSIGLTASQGAIISAVLNLGQGLGRPPVGYFSDGIGRINMAALATLLSGIFALAIWVPSNSFAVLVVYAIIGGSVIGTYWAMVASVTAEVVGLDQLPAALSLSWLVIVLPTLFSEPIALEIARGTPAKFLGTQLFSGLMYVGAALCLLPVRAWKIRQLEQTLQEKDMSGQEPSVATTSFWKAMFTWKRV